MKEKQLRLTCLSQIKINIFQKRFARSYSFIQMVKSNLTSLGQRAKLSHYLKLKVKLNILVVLYIKEFAVVHIVA